MCYGFPTHKTLQVQQFTENLYLSHPNPKAFYLSLFNLVKLLANVTNPNGDYPPFAYIVRNKDTNPEYFEVSCNNVWLVVKMCN